MFLLSKFLLSAISVYETWILWCFCCQSFYCLPIQCTRPGFSGVFVVKVFTVCYFSVRDPDSLVFLLSKFLLSAISVYETWILWCFCCQSCYSLLFQCTRPGFSGVFVVKVVTVCYFSVRDLDSLVFLLSKFLLSAISVYETWILWCFCCQSCYCLLFQCKRPGFSGVFVVKVVTVCYFSVRDLDSLVFLLSKFLLSAISVDETWILWCFCCQSCYCLLFQCTRPGFSGVFVVKVVTVCYFSVRDLDSLVFLLSKFLLSAISVYETWIFWCFCCQSFYCLLFQCKRPGFSGVSVVKVFTVCYFSVRDLDSLVFLLSKFLLSAISVYETWILWCFCCQSFYCLLFQC